MSRIRTNLITNRMANGAPTVSNGLVISGVTTVTTLDLNGDLDVDGHLNADNVSIAGVCTATSFAGDGSALTGISGLSVANQADNRLITCTGTTDSLNGEQYLTYTSQSSLNLTDGNGTSILGGNYLNLKRTTGNTNYINAPLADAELVISADEDIIFRTVHTADFNSTERLRINSLGNVSIGGADATPSSAAYNGSTLHLYQSGSSSVGSQIKWSTGASGHTASDGAYMAFYSDNNMYCNIRESGDWIFYTSNSERLRIDSTGRITQNGTTSADTASALTLKNGVSGNDHTILELISDPNQMSAIYFGASDDRYQGQIRYKDNDHYMSFYTDQAEKVRIHSTGQVSIGHHNYVGESHDAILVVKPNITDSSKDSIGILVDGDSGTGGGQSSPSMGIKIVNTNTWNNSTHQYGLYNEVGQQYVASGTGIFNKVSGTYGTTTGYHIELNKNNNAYTNGYGLTMNIKPTGSGGTNYFIYCQKDDTNLKMRVLQNGNLQNANNSYGSTSDVKLKENIVDANSQWDDIKSLRVRNFNFKDDPDKLKMLGVVAQEAEAVSAGLVEIDNDIEIDETTGEGKIVGTTKFVKYSILYMKAVKCLQEAQARIETLEAKVTALEGS